jgi:hypothetical protein
LRTTCQFMMLVAFRRLVLQCVKPAIILAMLYVNVVVSHVYDSTRVTLCSGFWIDFRLVYTKPGKQKILTRLKATQKPVHNVTRVES